MKLRHWPVFNGASMAQMVCATIKMRLSKNHGAFCCAIGFSPWRINGAVARKRAFAASLALQFGCPLDTLRKVLKPDAHGNASLAARRCTRHDRR